MRFENSQARKNAWPKRRKVRQRKIAGIAVANMADSRRNFARLSGNRVIFAVNKITLRTNVDRKGRAGREILCGQSESQRRYFLSARGRHCWTIHSVSLWNWILGITSDFKSILVPNVTCYLWKCTNEQPKTCRWMTSPSVNLRYLRLEVLGWQWSVRYAFEYGETITNAYSSANWSIATKSDQSWEGRPAWAWNWSSIRTMMPYINQRLEVRKSTRSRVC